MSAPHLDQLRAPQRLNRTGREVTTIVRAGFVAVSLTGQPLRIPEISECHRITGEDCFFLKVHLRSIDELGGLLDRFLVHGETTTSRINATPIARRDPPLNDD